MHTRRLITFLLGVWFVLILTIGAVATGALRVASHAAKSPPPEPARALYVIGEGMTDQLFRFIASEINRAVFETGGLVELGLLLILAAALFLQNFSRPAVVLAAVMIVTACASHFLLTPQVVSVGRMLDFRAAGVMVEERARLVNLNLMFGGLALARLACGAAITGILLHRRSRR